MKLLLCLLLSVATYAQLPNYYATPEQQITYLTTRLKLADSVLTETRKNKTIAITERDKRIKALEDSCNAQVDYYYQHSQQLSTTNETLSVNLDECNSQLETAKQELANWKPRTKAGVLLRKVRNGLAVVGGVAVLSGVLLLR